MTKRLKLRAALSLLLVLFSMPSAWAEAQYISGNSGPMWEYDSSTQTLTISGEGDMPDYTSTTYKNTPWYNYSSSMLSIVVEEGITRIGNWSFYGTMVTSVTLPHGLTSIGDSSFRKCSGLKSLLFPEGLQTLGKFAFFESGIESIDIPSSMMTIESDAFGKSSLKTLIIKEGVEVIGAGTFCGCNGLTAVSLPSSVKKIEDQAFEGCNFKSIIFSNSLQSIGFAAFRNCLSLEGINIPANVSTIGEDAFYGCPAIKSISINENNTTYDSRDNCNAIIETSTKTLISGCQNTIIPSNVETIGESAFCRCSGLTNIIIPSSVKTIDDDAFQNCSGLKTITINNHPNYVLSINFGAFSGCTSTTDVYCYASTLNFSTDNSYFKPNKATIFHVAANDKARWENLFSDRNVTFVGDLENIEKLTYDVGEGNSVAISVSESDLAAVTGELTIPSSYTDGTNSYDVTAIAEDAFANCTNLTAVSIPSTITSIGSEAFSGCAGLSSITIPSGVTEINASTFAGCSSLASVSLPTNISAIGNNAFDGCSSLSSITLPTGLTSIAKGAFKGTGLTTIEIPYSVKSVGESSFEGCSGLKSVTLPTDLAMIAKNTFLNCTSMTTVNIPVAVTKIEEGAFKNCDKLVAVTLPSGLVELGMSVFENSGLQSITLPPEVTAIAQKAFYSCRNLVSATLYAPQLTTYADNAFDDNAANRKISVLSDYVDTYKSNWSKYTNDIVPISLTLNDNPKNTAEKWCTYYNAVANVTVPAGVTIYKAQLDQANSKVMLSEVGGSIIAKGNAVMLKGSTSSINLSSAASAGSGDYTGNDLKGGTATPSTVAYTLAGINGVMGFYQYTGESLDPNKAHLEVAASGARSFIGFDSGTSTDVKLQTEADDSDQEWYTIDGRKLKGQPTQKGIYVKNGKKHVVK